jgi:hypothetical protein
VIFEHCHHLRRRRGASLPIPIPEGFNPANQVTRRDVQARQRDLPHEGELWCRLTPHSALRRFVAQRVRGWAEKDLATRLENDPGKLAIHRGTREKGDDAPHLRRGRLDGQVF